MKCLYCQKEFEPKTETAKFCSNKCRQKNYRKNMRDLLREVRESGKIVSAKIIKENEKTKAEIKIELPSKKQSKVKPEMSDFWKERMKNKLGL